MKIYSVTLTFLLLLISISSFTCKQKEPFSSKTIFLDTITKDTILLDTIVVDSVIVETTTPIVFYKEKVHASYYHDKFNGKRTASGSIFNNSEYTAAHKKIPFGTQVLVTNIANNKTVIVTITDRGPFTKGREIDLSKTAFMELSEQKKLGFLTVNLQILKE